MKKYFILPIAVVLGALSFTACSDDDDDNKADNSESTIVSDVRYKDKSYGQSSVDACAKVVDELENANTLIAQANLSSEQEAFLRQVLQVSSTMSSCPPTQSWPMMWKTWRRPSTVSQ